MTNNDLITLLCAHVGWPTPLSEPAAKRALDFLVDNDFVEHNNKIVGNFATTEKANAYIRALHTVQMPVRTWAVPNRTEPHNVD